MEDNNKKKLNIVVFPWVAFGHIIPFLQLSKELATKGHHIFFLSTPRNLERLPNIPHKLITLVPLPMPRIQNLPPNAEATSDVGFKMGTDLLKKAFDALQEPLTTFLEKSSPFDWIIYDFACYWIPPIADKFGIRKVFFSIYFATTLAILGPHNDDDEDQDSGTWTDLCSPPHWIPSLDSSLLLLPYEARRFYHGLRRVTSSGVSDLFRFRSCVRGCDLIAVRSCMELEGQYIQLIQEFENKLVLPTGLLPPSFEEIGGDTWHNISTWLEKHRKGSVVYIAFGSEFEPSQDQLTELAFGLELSELPFFWAFRRSQISTLELPQGFEDRTRDRGMVWTSWVPQLRIMSHESVGGFLTHCGWSSVIEAISFGKPLIMLPLAIEHGLYARMMVQKKVGVEITRNEEDGSFTRNSVVESLKMVLQDEAGLNFKHEAQKLSAIFADKGLQGQYIDRFSEFLCDQ